MKRKGNTKGGAAGTALPAAKVVTPAVSVPAKED